MPGTAAYLPRYVGAGVIVGGLVLAGIQLAPFSDHTGGVAPRGDLVPVLRGPLTISVACTGAIRSGNAVVIKNKVEGRTTVLWIIEEGTRVEEGTKLMELDSSELDDERLEEEIEVETSRAAYINAQQMLEIAKKQGQADIEAAAVEYRLALLDIEKYAGIKSEQYESMRARGTALEDAMEGSLLGQLNELAGDVAGSEENRQRCKQLLDQMDGAYMQEMRRALNQIIIADAELRRAQDYLAGSLELYELQFISKVQLQADELERQRKALEVEVAVGDLELLAQFTYRRTMEELSSAVNQRQFELEKARHEAEANLVDAQASMSARRERLVRDEQHLREIREQLAACTIRAPCAGLVVYGTTGQDGGRDDREEPLAEGVEVREQQDLFRLPTTDDLVADIKIHESMLERVSEGHPVRITTDALPGRSFRGAVSKIAPLPDAQSRWMNPDLKVYNTVVAVVGDPGALRTGMSCRAEIIVAEFEDTCYVPLQAVVRVDNQPTVYVPDPTGELLPRTIEVGLDDNRRIQLLGGLTEGELVSLTPPLHEGATSLSKPWDEPVEGEGAGPAAGRDEEAEAARAGDLAVPEASS